MDNITLPEVDTSHDYDGYADIGRDQFDANESAPPKEVVQQSDDPIVESNETDELHDNLEGKTYFPTISTTLKNAAGQGMHHHEILDAMDKHLPKVPHADADQLNQYLRNASEITPEVHAHVLGVLSKHAKLMKLQGGAPGAARTSSDMIGKYSWALHHSPEEIPTQTSREDSYLDESHIKKYSGDYQFRGGRILTHNLIGSHHHLNHDGSLSSVKGTFEERFPSELPHVSENYLESSNFHKFNLEELHTPYLRDSDKTKGIVSRYTADSKHINKTAAEINKGNGDPRFDGNDNNDKEVMSMHNAVVNAPSYEHKFTVYTGLSKSTNPKVAEESSPGRKTAHLKAFTSTSLDEPTARSFAVPHMKDPAIKQNVHDLLEINVPKNHKGGVYVDRVSENKGENEYILDHGTRVEHDAEPKYFANSDRLFRVWKNGTIVGNKKHEDFELEHKDPADHTASYVTRLQSSQLNSHRMAAAASPAANNRHIDMALNDPSVSVRFNAATNPNASSDNLKKAMKDQHSQVPKAAINNPNATEEHLKIGMDHSNLEVRANIAKHRLATPEMLSTLGKDPSYHVRFESAQNQNAPKELLQHLATDKEESIRRTAKYKLGLLNEEIVELMLKASEILKEG